MENERKVRVFCEWEQEAEQAEEYIGNPEAELRFVTLWNYTFVPNEAIEKKLSEFIYDVLQHAEGTYICTIEQKTGGNVSMQPEKTTDKCNNKKTTDMTIEDIQKELTQQAKTIELDKEYNGYYTGKIVIRNIHNAALMSISYDVAEGIVGNKKVKFEGDTRNTVDMDYTLCIMRSSAATVFEGMATVEDNLKA